MSTVDYTAQQNFSWRHGLLLVLLGGYDWEIIAPICFFFDTWSPLTNPTKYLVMMCSREIWGVTTDFICCTFARLFYTQDDIPPTSVNNWISKVSEDLQQPFFSIMWMDFSNNQSCQVRTCIDFYKCMKNTCGNWDMTWHDIIRPLRKY